MATTGLDDEFYEEMVAEYRANPKRFIHQLDTDLWKYQNYTEFAPRPAFLAFMLALLIEEGAPAGPPSLIRAYHKLVADLRADPIIVTTSYSDEEEDDEEQRQRERWLYGMPSHPMP